MVGEGPGLERVAAVPGLDLATSLPRTVQAARHHHLLDPSHLSIRFNLTKQSHLIDTTVTKYNSN